jgi:hypothetical protein
MPDRMQVVDDLTADKTAPQHPDRVSERYRLNRNRPGHAVTAADAYPGYYTLETTTTAGAVDGMLSVNAATGQVWYHTWHGRFIAREDS